MTITKFFDMASGGSSKEPFDVILIEAPESEAVAVFYARFGHNPQRVTCTCCGGDYAIDESDDLDEATRYDRNGFGWRTGDPDRQTVADYLASGRALFIPAADITPAERKTSVPEQGYVWQD